MLKINYNPYLYVFTCNIPSEIEISSDAASVYVTIACGPDTIFETTLYPYNNIAMLYDARSIIEGHMLDKQRVFANFVITADTKTEETTTPERHFIYSRLSLATNAMGFVQLFFLTTRSMFTIPRNSFQTLSAFYLPDVTLQGYTECLALFDGESTPRMVRIEEAKHFSQLLLSRYVNIVEIGGALAPITVTDINSEVSDADNATNSIKFKYKYSSHHFPITIDYGNNIFDDPFYRTFD